MYTYLNTDTNRELSKLLNEEWKQLKGYEGLYEISNHGRVKSMRWGIHKKEHILKPWVGVYIFVALSKDKRLKTYRLHKLVAENFLENPNGYKLVNHKDADKHNNRVDNLEWCNHSMNNKHAYKMGLIDQRREKNGNHKVDELTVKYIRHSKKIAPWVTNVQLAKAYNISPSQVGNIVNNLNWK